MTMDFDGPCARPAPAPDVGSRDLTQLPFAAQRKSVQLSTTNETPVGSTLEPTTNVTVFVNQNADAGLSGATLNIYGYLSGVRALVKAVTLTNPADSTPRQYTYASSAADYFEVTVTAVSPMAVAAIFAIAGFGEEDAATAASLAPVLTLAGDVTGPANANLVTTITGSAGSVTLVATTFTQGTAATAATVPTNITFSPMAPNAGASTLASGTPGSVILNFANPVSPGVDAGLVLQQASVSVWQLGSNTLGQTRGFAWAGPNAVAPSSSNYLIQVLTGQSVLNDPNQVTIGIGGIAETVTIATGTQFFSATTSFGGGVHVLGITDAATSPTSNPVGGGILYSVGGAGTWRGSSGTITTFGPAEPHCPRCRRDYVFEAQNDERGEHLAICWSCFCDEAERVGLDVGSFAFVRELKKVA